MNKLKVLAWTLFAAVGLVALAGFTLPAKKTDTTPVGTVVAWAGDAKSLPAKWMICNGRLLSKDKYDDLYAAIGESWGGTDTSFNLPDLRGRFIRGVDDNSDRDPDADERQAARKGGNTKGVGSVQEDAVQEHSHHQPPHSHKDRYHTNYQSGSLGVGGTSFLWNPVTKADTDSVAPEISGVIKYRKHAAVKASEETRPKNANVYFIIKVK